MARQILSYELIEGKKKEYLNFGGVNANFQRTCRVPLGQMNSLPAGLGSFPVFTVKDFRSGCPKEWRDDGYFLPMYRQEAMWINFGRGAYNPASPRALIVGAGNINAVSGKPFDSSKDRFAKRKKHKRVKSGLDIRLEKDQNYLVVPPQPWLDGWKAEDGKVYQFVAAEMGSGETVEGQITGEETVGGIQFIVYEPKEGQKLVHATSPHEYIVGGSYGEMQSCFGVAKGAHVMSLLGSSKSLRSASVGVQAMGLGRGGEIIQKIYPDPYGLEVWKDKPTAVEVIYLVSSEDFKQITGHEAPPTPVTYEKYQQFGLPWFELHDQKYKDTEGSGIFEKLKPVGEGLAKGKPVKKAHTGQPDIADVMLKDVHPQHKAHNKTGDCCIHCMVFK